MSSPFLLYPFNLSLFSFKFSKASVLPERSKGLKGVTSLDGVKGFFKLGSLSEASFKHSTGKESTTGADNFSASPLGASVVTKASPEYSPLSSMALSAQKIKNQR